jgi:DNA-directed RNA polymerase specialized sigma24 family protein
MYVPISTPIDFDSRIADEVGGHKHAKYIDLVAALGSTEDEEVALLYEHHHTEKEIGDMLGVSQQAISHRLHRIRQRANRCTNGPRCGCRTFPARRSES